MLRFLEFFLSLSLSFAGHTLLKALDIRFLKDLNFNQYSAEENEEDKDGKKKKKAKKSKGKKKKVNTKKAGKKVKASTKRWS